jgi:hypothetical protein
MRPMLFLKQHPILKVIWLGKKAPNITPTECLVNRRLAVVVKVNRGHMGLDNLEQNQKIFFGNITQFMQLIA